MAAASSLSDYCKVDGLADVLSAIRRGVRPDTKTLTFACCSDSLPMVEAVMAAGARPDAVTLRAACHSRNYEIVQRVVKAGAIADDVAFAEAKRTGDTRILTLVERVLGKSPPPPTPSDLKAACQSSDSFALQRALARGARPDNRTILWAACAGKHEIVEAVVRVGARAEEYERSSPDSSLLSNALLSRNPAKAILLHQAGSKPRKGDLDSAIDNQFYAKRYYPEYYAKCVELTTSLVRCRAPVSEKTLPLACTIIDGEFFPTLIDAVLELGGRPDATVYANAMLMNVSYLDKLTAAGALPTEEALSSAIAKLSDPQIVKRILDAGISPNRSDFRQAHENVKKGLRGATEVLAELRKKAPDPIRESCCTIM